MRKIFFSLLLGSSITFAGAQKTDTLSVTQKRAVSLEEVLGIPSTYTALKCDISLNAKDGNIIRVFYAKDSSRWCVNEDSRDFVKLWHRIIDYAPHGDKIIIAEIIVQKGDKELKWAPKAFIVP
jgi:hypothetical protein